MLCVCVCARVPVYVCFSGPGKLEAMFRTALNEDQRAAVRKLVTAKDYALLLGMPGTGEYRRQHRASPFFRLNAHTQTDPPSLF